MSKALAFVAGISVIIAALLFLFTPVTSDDPVANAPDHHAETSGNTNGSSVSSATGGGSGHDVSKWPDPDVAPALPEPTSNAARNARPVISLWQSEANPEKTEVDGFPAIQLQADPEALATLHVGQQLAMPVPELGRTVTARLDGTHNQLNDIQVFRGPVTGGHEKDNVVVTRGKTATYVVISTNEGVYSAVINNQTGETTLTSESDIHDNLAGEDDAIPVPGVEQHPPSS